MTTTPTTPTIEIPTFRTEHPTVMTAECSAECSGAGVAREETRMSTQTTATTPKRDDYVPTLVPDFRLDIATDPDFCAKGYGKKLRAIGGKYSECRGQDNTSRFLTIPNTTEGRDFAAEVAKLFGGGRRSGRHRGALLMVLHPHRHGCGYDSTSHNVRRENALDDINHAFAVFDCQERAWWATVGRPAADAARVREAAERAADLADVPDSITRAVRRALALGASEETIRGACEVALLEWAQRMAPSPASKG